MKNTLAFLQKIDGYEKRNFTKFILKVIVEGIETMRTKTL
jgi:hypothetical protein